MFASDWKPPENPDPHEILHEAGRNARNERYELALIKHVWFHQNALKYQPSLSGVRLSFALADWLELGESYPPALAKFKEIRDETKQRIYQDEGSGADRHDFHDLASMNEYLGEPEATVKAFHYLDKHNGKAAKTVYDLAEPALIEAREYQLCGKYLAPDVTWPRIVVHFEHDREMAENPKFGKRHLDFTNKNYINGATTLVALLVVNDRQEEAEEIAEAARKQPIDDDFQEQFNKELAQALKGTVPTPWP